MKYVKMISGSVHQVSYDEAENVKKMWLEDPKSPIELRNGTAINPACIESVGNLQSNDLIPYFWGNRMSRDLTKVCVEGEWKKFIGEKKEIEWKDRQGNIIKGNLTVT